MDQALQALLNRLEHLSAPFRELREGVQKAVIVAELDPEMALTRTRKVLEYVIRDVYLHRIKEPPGTRPLENLLQRLVKDGHFPDRLDAYANTIRKLGNVGTHTFGEKVTAEDVSQSLGQLLPILDWYFEVERPEALVQKPVAPPPAPSAPSKPTVSPLVPQRPSRSGVIPRGRVIDGLYEVRGELGRGAFGVVYQCWDRKYKREVAVKVLLDKVLEDPRAVKRFLLEAEVLCGITHPNVVPVLGHGRDDQHYYIVFPLIRGRLVKDLIANGDEVDPARAIRLTITLVKALHYVYSKHAILHRDIKPANIMVVEDDALYLMDFGLAACQDRTLSPTASGIVGTPAYMSPEQASGNTIGQVCHQSDLYGAGAVLYHLLTGRFPYSGPMPGVLKEIIDKNTKPRRPSLLRPTLDPALDRIVLKALEKDPRDRYADGLNFAETLQSWLDLNSSSARFKPPRPLRATPAVKDPGGSQVRASARPAAKVVVVPVPPVATESVSTHLESTLDPPGPVAKPIGARPASSPALPATAPHRPSAGVRGLVLAALGLVWFVGAMVWALWVYRLPSAPVVGDWARRGFRSTEPAANPTPTLWVYATGAALLLALLTWIGFTVKHFRSKH
jgi:serine/threonine protein kinase